MFLTYLYCSLLLFIYCLLYCSDDTSIYASAYYPYILYRYLQTHSNAFLDWYSLWRVKIPENKINAVYFSRKVNYPRWESLLKTLTEWPNDAKYLGVFLDNNLPYNKYSRSIRNKISETYNSLKPLFIRDTLRYIANYFCITPAFYLSLSMPVQSKALLAKLLCLISIVYIVENLKSVRNGSHYLCNST